MRLSLPKYRDPSPPSSLSAPSPLHANAYFSRRAYITIRHRPSNADACRPNAATHRKPGKAAKNGNHNHGKPTKPRDAMYSPHKHASYSIATATRRTGLVQINYLHHARCVDHVCQSQRPRAAETLRRHTSATTRSKMMLHIIGAKHLTTSRTHQIWETKQNSAVAERIPYPRRCSRAQRGCITHTCLQPSRCHRSSTPGIKPSRVSFMFLGQMLQSFGHTNCSWP